MLEARKLLAGIVAPGPDDPGSDPSSDDAPKPTATPQQAIDLIDGSPWGKTPDGLKVVKLLRDDLANGKLQVGKLDPDENGVPIRGQYSAVNDTLTINSAVGGNGDVGSLASVLVHEGSHQQWRVDNGIQDASLDNEYNAFKNQALFFGGLPVGQKPTDPDLKAENQGALDAYKDGTLRDLVQKTYPMLK